MDNIQILRGYKDGGIDHKNKDFFEGMVRLVHELNLPAEAHLERLDAAHPQCAVFLDLFDITSDHHAVRAAEIDTRRTSFLQTFLAKTIGQPKLRAPKRAFPLNATRVTKWRALVPDHVCPSSHVGCGHALELTCTDMHALGTRGLPVDAVPPVGDPIRNAMHIFSADWGVLGRLRETSGGITAQQRRKYNEKHQDAPVRVGEYVPVPGQVALYSPGWLHVNMNFMSLITRVHWTAGLYALAQQFKQQYLDLEAKNFQPSERFVAQTHRGCLLAYWGAYAERKGLGKVVDNPPDTADGHRYLTIEYDQAALDRVVSSADGMRRVAQLFEQWVRSAGGDDVQFRFWGEQFALDMAWSYFEGRQCVRYEDGKGLMLMLLFDLPYFRITNRENYTALIFNTLADVFCRLSPYFARVMLLNMTVNVTGNAGHAIAADHLCEISVHCIKMFHPQTWEQLQRIGASSELMACIKATMLKIMGHDGHSSHHVSSSDPTIRAIARVFWDKKVPIVTPGRKLTPLGSVPQRTTKGMAICHAFQEFCGRHDDVVADQQRQAEMYDGRAPNCNVCGLHMPLTPQP